MATSPSCPFKGDTYHVSVNFFGNKYRIRCLFYQFPYMLTNEERPLHVVIEKLPAHADSFSITDFLFKRATFLLWFN